MSANLVASRISFSLPPRAEAHGFVLPAARLFIIAVAWLLFGAFVALAHPMGNFSVNHYSRIDLQANQVTLEYIIDLAEIPAYQEMLQAGIPADAKDAAALHFAASRGQELVRGLSLVIEGKTLPLHMVSSTILFPPGAGGLPTMKLGYRFAADYPAGVDRARASLRYEDQNFPGQTGWKEIIATASGATRISSSAPTTDLSNRLSDYPTDLLNSPPQVLEATIVASLPAVSTPLSAPGAVANSVAAKHPATPAPARILTHATAALSNSRRIPSKPESVVTPASALTLYANRQQTPRNRFTELIAAPHLSLWFLVTAALIAIGLGGLHALEPGHGKTIVAAYLVGSRGTARHAALLGLIVTVSHTAGVFALGAITLYASRYIVPEQLYPWLALLSALIIVALGASMALRRLTGLTTEHSHLPGDGNLHWPFLSRKADPTPADPQLSPSSKPVTLTQLLTLGISGGIIPCPAALIVLLSAVALHRIGLGFFLIVAFSIGLAAVLISFGMLMVYARRFMSQVITDGPLTRRWLPLLSSLFIVVLGTALAVQAFSSLHLNIHLAAPPKVGALFFVIGLGLVLGMRHSTDADHVVAISTIVTRQKSIRGAAIIGSVWGIGHTITVFIVGALIILFNVEIPPRVGLAMEFSVAVMLVLLGVLNLTGVMQKVTRFFTPSPAAKPEPVSHTPTKWWSSGASPIAELGIYQCLRPLVIGLVHGLAGSAAVALLVLSTIHNPLWATLYLLIFGAGTMVGMMVMTATMAAPLRFAGQRSATLSRHLATASGLVSLAFGTFLVFQLGFVGGLFTSHPVWTPQ